jgi:hypothetical protein
VSFVAPLAGALVGAFTAAFLRTFFAPLAGAASASGLGATFVNS